MAKKVPVSLVCLLGLLSHPGVGFARQVSLSRNVSATPGQTVTVKLDIDDAGGIESVDLRILYPTEFLDLALDGVRTGVLTANAALAANVQEAEGQIIVGLATARALGSRPGSLLELDFQVRSAARGREVPIDLQSVSLNEDEQVLKLFPTPTPGPDPSDGSIAVVSTEVEVSPSACDFGEVEVGKEETCVVKVRNVGRIPLVVTAVSLPAGSPDFEHNASAPFEISAGQSRVITLTYRPREAGEDLGGLELEFEGGENDRLTVPLSGRGKQFPGPPFRRGDADMNGRVEVTDDVALLGYLFLGLEKPVCLDAADADDDGLANITDAVLSLNYQFLGGPPPLPPGPIECGSDVDLEVPDLGCDPGCR